MPKFLFPLLIAIVFFASNTVARSDSGELSPSDLKIYRAAFAAVKKDRWAEARSLASRARNPLPAKVIQWLDLTRPGPGRSFSDLSAFLEVNPDWPGRLTMQAQAERAMPDGLPADAVLVWFGDRRPLTIDGAIQLGRAMLARKLEPQAAAMLRWSWVQLDMNASDEKTFLTLFKQYLRPEDQIARLDRLLWDGHEESARRMMNRVGAGYRALAEARLRLRDMAPGVDAAIAQVPPALMRDPGLIYERARWRRRKDMHDSVVELLDPPLKNVTRPDLLWRETESAARRALARGDISVAYRLAQSHGTTEGISFADGEWLAGWIALRFLAERQTAYDHFTRLYAGVSSAISKSRGAYWAGRAAEEMGDVALAQNWYQKAAENLTTFYGQLAAHRLGREEALRFEPLPEPTSAERAAFAKHELVRVVRVLGQLGETDRVRPFLIRMTDLATTSAEHRLIADLAAGLGRDDLAVATAKEARQKGVELVDYLYPLRRLPAHEGPEDALILAIVRQESAFATDAVSSAGARGLMQLMPATAKQVARKLGLRYDPSKLTNDPDFNIRLGSAYLNGLVQRFEGSYVLAAAGYNAGPSRANEWVRVYGDPRDHDVDVVDWIEMIPFSETRNYVQRVLENLQVYRHRLGHSQIALRLEQDLLRRVAQ